jgi:putative restriction endonuclease
VSLTGTIAPTDFGWYEFLSDRGSWTEVNFWTPSTHFAFRADEFSPFLFKLKAPHSAICGFGYFASYSPLPDWLAWNCFGEGNGCESLAVMRERISEIRRRMRYVGSGSERIAEIGCIVVVNVTLFSPDEWVAQPSDWPIRNLRPMRYDLERGEGARVWAACLERLSSYERKTVTMSSVLHDDGPRYGAEVMVRPRLGQGAFRIAVTDAYDRACAVTGEHSLPALEAVHIKPFALEGPHSVSNGLLLRADIHRLFEQGYVTVTPDNRLEVSERLRADFNNGKTYYPLRGTRVAVPKPDRHRPDAALLRWHNEAVFLG